MGLRRLHFQILLACAYNEWIEYNLWIPPKAIQSALKKWHPDSGSGGGG